MKNRTFFKRSVFLDPAQKPFDGHRHAVGGEFVVEVKGIFHFFPAKKSFYPIIAKFWGVIRPREKIFRKDLKKLTGYGIIISSIIK